MLIQRYSNNKTFEYFNLYLFEKRELRTWFGQHRKNTKFCLLSKGGDSAKYVSEFKNP